MSMSKSVCSCCVSEHTTSLTNFGTRSAQRANGNVQRRAKYNDRFPLHLSIADVVATPRQS